MKKLYSVDDKLATINENYSKSKGITQSRIIETALIHFYNDIVKMDLQLPKQQKVGRPSTTIRR